VRPFFAIAGLHVNPRLSAAANGPYFGTIPDKIADQLELTIDLRQ
jgi:hypothetical protein